LAGAADQRQNLTLAAAFVVRQIAIVIVGDDHPVHGSLGRILPRGAMVRYREWYGASAPNVGLKLTAEAVADGIIERERDEPRELDGESSIRYGVLDPAAFSSDGGPSIAERMSTRKIFFRRADNARVSARGAMGGWDQVRARLIGDGERPMIYFFHTCYDSIRTLPALQHDLVKAEDVDTESEDHAPDEIRYACMSRPYVKQIVKRPADKLLMVGPGNQVTLDDLWETPAKHRNERV
jgi:hypothetical protein